MGCILSRASMLALAGSFTLLVSTRAAVTNVAWYRLGEYDAGGISGLAVTNTTADVIGTRHLKQFGSPLYSNAISDSASNRVGSLLAIHLGGASQYLSNAVVSTAVDNFGIELWVKPDSSFSGGKKIIAWNGNSPFEGWGFYQNDGNYVASLGAFTEFSSSTVVGGVWTHLALVRNNGLSTFYVNGVGGSGNVTAPSVSTGGFEIGYHGGFGGSSFAGTVDEVRVFTFAPGQFSTNDLLFNAQRIATLPATNVTPTGATLAGVANPLGQASMAWFEWGTTTNYGNVTPAQSLGHDFSNTNFTQTLSNLTVGVTYHFRAVASNAPGTAFGLDQSFNSPLFADSGITLTDLGFSSAAWGDFDNDGWPDILIMGTNIAAPSQAKTQVWRNTGNGFTNIDLALAAFTRGAVAWGDFNNDGQLDFVLTGYRPGTFSEDIQLYQNTGTGFINVTASQGLGNADFQRGSVAWGDYDGDGHLDILLGGQSPSGFTTQLWRNSGDGFSDVTHLVSLLIGGYSSVNWGDFDNDGRPDILFRQHLWRNTGNTFSGIPLLGLVSSGDFPQAVAWGDYDNDSRLDVLIAGSISGTNSTQLFRNTGSGFDNVTATVAAGLPGVQNCSLAWGDYDNDGRIDILLTGTNSQVGAVAQVWKNTPSGFTNINAPLPGYSGCAIWGDYDRDGRLDILLTGMNSSNQPLTRLYRNQTGTTNTPPSPPTVLAASASYEGVKLSWNSGSDAQTPASGLSYNVRAGTTPGGTNLLTSHVNIATGVRSLPALGNAFASHQLMISGVTNGEVVYWSVQAIDSAFAGSSFAPESSFRFYQPPPLVTLPGVVIPPTGDTTGDGIVDQSELNAVLSNYFSTSPWLQMTNVAGLSETNVTFALTNSLAGDFSVEYSTNLADWYFLGPATPRYLFTDTNAPAVPQRSYRLRWP